MRLLSVYFIFMHLIAGEGVNLPLVIVTWEYPNATDKGEGVNLPLVIVTWEYPNATDKAYGILTSGGSSVDAVEEGCTFCEDYPSKCRYSVGFEGKVDENGEATLDAMIMDGTTLNVGAVGGIRRIKRATTVARHVLDYTRHSLLVGDQATDFAKDFVGLPEEDLNTDYNREVFESWKDENCQPNFWMNVQPDPTENCGPYSPSDQDKVVNLKETSSPSNHDTIGIVAVDSVGNVASAASTNGLNHKIPGRVGDSPIPGAGSYADNDVGGAAATGDGDVMIRFLPSYQTVENMRNGMDPKTAASDALRRIAVKYPQYMGAVIGATNDGEYGIACYGYEEVQYCTQDPKSGGPYCRDVTCDVTTSTSACLQSIALSWWISVVLISASLSAHLF